MSKQHLVYTPRPGAIHEAEVAALAAVYQFVLAKKKAAGVTSTSGDDAKKGSLKHEVRAKHKSTR